MIANPVVWIRNPLVPEALDLLETRVRVIRPANRLDGLEEAVIAIGGTEISWDAELLARFPALQAVVRTGIGYDNIDVQAATSAGVCVVNTPEAPTESTAEFTMALMLAVARNLKSACMALHRGEWRPVTEFVGFDLQGKRLGLVGFGRIGQRVAELARAFQMEVIAYDPWIPAERMTANGVIPARLLEGLLECVDVVSLHLPMSDSTRHLMGEKEFARMKPGAVLINAARGGLVNPAALEKALLSGQLAGAGLDVWEPEPVQGDNPILALPNVVGAPHIGAATREGRKRSHTAAARAALAIIAGQKPEGLVNPDVWHRRR